MYFLGKSNEKGFKPKGSVMEKIGYVSLKLNTVESSFIEERIAIEILFVWNSFLSSFSYSYL